MNLVLCQLGVVLEWLLKLYTIILIVYALVSWIPDIRGRWTSYLAMLVEPVLLPIRRIVPPVGGLDLAFLIVILVLNFVVRPALDQTVFGICNR